MRLFIVAFLGLALSVPAYVHAQSCAVPPGDPSKTYSASNKIITFYVPHNAPNCANSIEGCVATSCPGLKKVDGKYERKPTCLDAVRLKQAQYVTIASAASNYGKYYNLGTITYKSALDNKTYTVDNVIGYVHDTGCAFNGTCSAAMRARFGFSAYPRPDKLDVCTTVCPTCTDSQAGAYASGRNATIQKSSSGLFDSNTVPGGLPLGQAYGAMAPSGSQARGGTSATGGFGGATPAGGMGVGGSIGSQLLNSSLPGNASSDISIVSDKSAAILFVHAIEVRRGGNVRVSWATVGMKSSPVCSLRLDGRGETVAQSNASSQTVRIPADMGNEAVFVLSCSPQTGAPIERRASVSVL